MLPTECIFHMDVLDQIKERYKSKIWNTEYGGMILGWRDNSSIYITGAFFPPQQEKSGVFCKFSGCELARCRTALIEAIPKPETYEINILGWVHTHPGLKIFMSGTDYGTFRDWVKMDQNAVAVVIDPYVKHPDDIGCFNRRIKKIPISIKETLNLPSDVIEYLESFQAILMQKYLDSTDTILVSIPQNESKGFETEIDIEPELPIFTSNMTSSVLTTPQTLLSELDSLLKPLMDSGKELSEKFSNFFQSVQNHFNLNTKHLAMIQEELDTQNKVIMKSLLKLGKQLADLNIRIDRIYDDQRFQKLNSQLASIHNIISTLDKGDDELKNLSSEIKSLKEGKHELKEIIQNFGEIRQETEVLYFHKHNESEYQELEDIAVKLTKKERLKIFIPKEITIQADGLRFIYSDQIKEDIRSLKLYWQANWREVAISSGVSKNQIILTLKHRGNYLGTSFNSFEIWIKDSRLPLLKDIFEKNSPIFLLSNSNDKIELDKE
ncbi:MAG: hypothetical protein ACFFCQ_08860 [Promethearchaeota archaeon]